MVDEEETVHWKPNQPPVNTVKDPPVKTVKFQKSPGEQMGDIGSVFESKDVTLACRSVGSDSGMATNTIFFCLLFDQRFV